ncbi:hypothetical protein B0H14DRAFT_2567597 [Mycena olivaceomarginata]|nr:hypothetical protein B0H14DRAFT_2567597 [Mycena olivaceomarginata]
MHHQLLMKAVAEEYRAGKSELPIVTKLVAKDNANASVDVSASTHEGDRLDTPLSSTARAARLQRGHIHNVPSSPCHPLLSHAHLSGCRYPGPRPPRCPPYIDTYERSPSTSSTTTSTVHGSHRFYSYSCTAVAHQQLGLLDRSPARHSPVLSGRCP